MTTANPYDYGPQNDAEREANDQVCREAVRLVALSYLAETRGRPLNRRLRAEQEKAARLARGLVLNDQKRGRP
jgi:hypothetical protein